MEFVSDVTTKEVALIGGYGAGKSMSICVKTIHLASMNIGHTGIIVEPSFPMIMDPLLPLMFDTLENYDIPYSFKQTPNPVLTLHFADGDATVLFKSAEQVEKLRGINAAFVIVDEIDTLGEAKAAYLWQILQGRVRKGNVLQMNACSTPEGYGFLYNHFQECPEEHKPNRRIIRAKTTDNPFLPQSYIDSLLANYPSQLITSYMNGEFVNLTTGNVYYAFNRVTNHTNKTYADYAHNPEQVYHVGIDFNVGKCSAVIGVVERDKKCYIIDEITDAYNTEALITEIKRRLNGKKVWTYPDSSGKSEKTNASTTDIMLLRNAGLNPMYNTKNPFVRDRVGSVNARFKNAAGDVHMYVNTSTCPNLTKSLEQQGFDSFGAPDKSKGLDHVLDAMGYMVYYNWPIAGRPTATIM